MTKPSPLPAPTATTPTEPGCPFRLRNGCPVAQASPGHDRDGEARYVQVRRQGIYLAACVVDDVAALGLSSPERVVEEIRRRICELVRCELQASARSR